MYLSIQQMATECSLHEVGLERAKGVGRDKLSPQEDFSSSGRTVKIILKRLWSQRGNLELLPTTRNEPFIRNADDENEPGAEPPKHRARRRKRQMKILQLEAAGSAVRFHKEERGQLKVKPGRPVAARSQDPLTHTGPFLCNELRLHCLLLQVSFVVVQQHYFRYYFFNYYFNFEIPRDDVQEEAGS